MISVQKTMVAGLVMGVLAGCGAGKVPPSDLPKGQLPVASPAGEYKIQIGDTLSIKFFYNKELNEDIVVRPDGRISLQLIPEVVAAGQTPAALAEHLESLYSGQMEHPEIAVIVRTFSAQRIYVDGEVKRPGELALVGPTTVMQAIAEAGGITDVGKLSEVIVVRRGLSGEPVVMRVDVKKARKGDDPSQDLGLVPYDVVYVPRTGIGNVNSWVDRYIRRNIPVSFGFRVDINP